MVFHCRCFSFEEFEYETRARSTSTQTYYTASSDFNPIVPEKPSVFSNLAPKTSNLRVFRLSELKAATNNFCKDSEIGKGGVGIVYKGVIKSLVHPFDEIQVAVKYANGELQGHKEWVTEVNVLGAVEHPNLVKLVGYCYNERRAPQRLLVYEYMPNKSVEYHLSTTSEPPLSWTTRLKLARDVARGLAYLHEEMGFQIIFEGFKSSSILLDDQWNAKLSFFGLAKLRHAGEREPTSRNEGYKAPECFRTKPTSKSDVWSYGVFLYELITGRRPFDKNRPKNEQKLLEWVKPYRKSRKLQLVIDSRLEADRCLSKDPKSRPKMSEKPPMEAQRWKRNGVPQVTEEARRQCPHVR
ncbi:hypothetical protein L6452_29262 [Arctium lappa]|uniref:Uncharacterized protein n=1 Tax=Arctium lappa TaxID=4217 RepID=A0ACB8ZHE2_ARCLA|nr:hypothetical protein L6452_29262 [Arctium lappa]